MAGRLPRVPRLGAGVTLFSNGGGMWMPAPFLGINLQSHFGFVLDADGEKTAFIFRVPKTGTLNKVHFRTGTVTTGDDLKVSFQNVDVTDGDPDETVDQFRVITIADGDDDTWNITGIVSSDGTDSGTKRSVTRGEFLSIVIEFDSFVAGALEIDVNLGDAANKPVSGALYFDHKTGGTWAKHNNSLPCFGLEYDDGSFAYIPGVLPAKTYEADTSFNTSTTPDEYGLKFQLPFKCKVGGAWYGTIDIDNAAELILYDSDGSTELENVTLDPDIRSIVNLERVAVWFSDDIELLADTNYRLVLKPTTTSNLIYRGITVDSAGLLDQMEGGQLFHKTERTDAGAWTDTTTSRPSMGLIVTGA